MMMGYKTEKEAQSHCDKVLAILGRGWQGRVWDNIGWHCAWQKGSVSLYHETHGKYYFALVGDPGSNSGHMDLSNSGAVGADDPKKAVLKACAAAQEVFEMKWKPIELSVATVVLDLGVQKSACVQPETQREFGGLG